MILSTLEIKKGDLIQFPCQAIRKVFVVNESSLTVVSLKNARKKSKYSLDFVLGVCFLVPPKTDLQEYLNNSFARFNKTNSAEIKETKILEGYFIDDEEILDMPINEDHDD